MKQLSEEEGGGTRTVLKYRPRPERKPGPFRRKIAYPRCPTAISTLECPIRDARGIQERITCGVPEMIILKRVLKAHRSDCRSLTQIRRCSDRTKFVRFVHRPSDRK
eukprot:COSAG05_NODE_1910_length_3845_cov_2.662306_5_plen_107_part_00